MKRGTVGRYPSRVGVLLVAFAMCGCDLSDTVVPVGDPVVVNTFVIGDADDVFRAGRDHIVSVALTDQNYFDFSRSSKNSYTGRGFINRLAGGIGLFGCLVASSTNMRAFGDAYDPREGAYTLRGTYLDDVTVDLQWDLYLALPNDSTEFSAFVEGPGSSGAYG